MIETFFFDSPLFKKEKRVLAIFTSQVSNGYTLFFYDGHVLNTSVKDLDTPTGIDIDICLEKGYRVIALSSMINEGNIRWSKRKKELINFKDDKFVFNEFVNQIIKQFKKQGETWISVGFSLSGQLVLLNEKSFDYIIAISPALVGFEQMQTSKGVIFYGSQEVAQDADAKYNLPIKQFASYNHIRAFELENMVHDFHSWRDHFAFILNQFEEVYGLFK